MALKQALESLSGWLETFRLHEAMQNDPNLVPAVQTVHILAIGFVFSSSLILSLRASGLSAIGAMNSRSSACRPASTAI